jgi:16S rRNA (adenine1518-N6/adenine1519-N6)-dimethyltransferase
LVGSDGIEGPGSADAPTRRGPLPGRRQRRLGQNFLADTNLLDAIVADADLGPDDVVLEVGGGSGVLTERLAESTSFVHLIELDRGLADRLEPLADRLGNLGIVWDDALRVELSALDPPPNKMVANLPYSIATPLLIRTIIELPSVQSWLVMVQKEVADRLTADPGSKIYGSPSVVVGIGCEAKEVRKVDPAVFVPRPRVASSLIRIERTGPPPDPALHALIRESFAHRRKSLPRSLETTEPGRAERARQALVEMGLAEDSRAESLSPDEFAEFGALMRGAR